jgi:pyruvate/2-oxoglutarate/acetoin dehydrogenase E1 component/TPP-dependent pyruvate/acetoin dehydrogenase alpha subunit
MGKKSPMKNVIGKMPEKTSKQKSLAAVSTNGQLPSQNGHAHHSPFEETGLTREEILSDYRICHQSRLASVLGRREVLTGKAKFGIFGDGKELPQVAMARVFQNGDWRAGYYRDQTFMIAAGIHSVQEFFAQLYAHTSVTDEPASAGRMMNGHFGTRSLNEDGSWKNVMTQKNSSADVSPTSGQMPRLVGLAYASKLYRDTPVLQQGFEQFSDHGNEVAFGTIGNASTSEGMFWEAFNAAGVLRVPMAISVWDDGYGISVPAKYQTTKENISEILKGFETNEFGEGYIIYRVNGWDYPALLSAYREGTERARKEHTPVLFHITELTQPQGHSTSGSHERYKSKERLEWETEHDCVTRFREWIVGNAVATADEMDAIDAENKKAVDTAKQAAWDAYLAPIRKDISDVSEIFDKIGAETGNSEIAAIKDGLNAIKEPTNKDIYTAVGKVLRSAGRAGSADLRDWKENADARHEDEYSSHIYSESAESALNVPEIKPQYNGDEAKVDGRQVMQACFDHALARDPRVFAIGEDIGVIGDVNKGFEDMQAKYGELRVTDTGIREATIIGQGIGAAMRGLRPIVEIQYLDYLIFGLEPMTDDLATVQWRTKGGQKAPVIVRTRGHRLEGVWHSGSPMSMILGSLRGMYVLVPRNMTQAAGFYNTMLQSDDTALIIEVLNGYRLKETIPANVGEFTVPLGVPEILREGTDVTLVTYGAMCRIAMECAEELAKFDISMEVIDVQTLLPFDRYSVILESLKKTNRIVFADEDVPGGATAYMMREVIEKQGGYRWLDSDPVTITGTNHRPAYGSDGDYFSKPNVETMFERIYALMHESDPARYPSMI